MHISDEILLFINKFFPPQRHPFNLQLNGSETYAAWQYEKGSDTVARYAPLYGADDMIKGKKVLDMGCGAGGKSVYYLALGASEVTGVDNQLCYEEQALAFAAEKGYDGALRFIVGDAGNLPLGGGSFDTVVMNDFFEHAENPEQVLREALRLICRGGRIFINFPPYFHPFGAHLSDAVNIPWVHVFFSEKTLIRVYKRLVAPLADGGSRIKLRIPDKGDGNEYFSYINKMSIRRFHKILKTLAIKPEYLSYTPLRPFLKPAAHLPVLREFFAKNVTCVIYKD